jgi:hypothetical protein
VNLDLPPSIEAYFASENAHDASAVERCFALNAVVQDEGRSIEGLAAIKAWRAETQRKYNHTVEPLAVAERGGRIVVTGKVTGNFPGSPIDLDHVFQLEGGRIVSLQIR